MALITKKYETVAGFTLTSYQAKEGAQALAIAEVKDDQLLIIEWRKWRKWFVCSPLQLLQIVQKNRYMYEVIHKFPHKVYFDIDGDQDCPPLAYIKATITKYFPDASMAISGSIIPTKHSYHITLNNYMVQNEQEKKALKQLVCYIRDNDNKYFDTCVYDKNRNFKCVNQSKTDQRVQAVMENDNLQQHLITCFFTDKSTWQPFPDVSSMAPVQEHAAKEKAKRPLDLGKLPDLTFDVTDDFDFFTATPLQVLQVIPLEPSYKNSLYNHTYTHTVARYCYRSGLSLEQFLAWLCKKHIGVPEEIKKKWTIIHWPNLEKFTDNAAFKVKGILQKYYPHMFKDKSFRHFKTTFNLPPASIQKIDRLSPEHFEDPAKYLIFNIGMGGGKTAQAVDYLKVKTADRIEITTHRTETEVDLGEGTLADHIPGVSRKRKDVTEHRVEKKTKNETEFLWIAPNRALSANTLTRLLDAGINVTDYLAFNSAVKKQGALTTAGSLMIVLNSLHYLQDKTYDIVVIDEVETVVDKMLGDFINKQGNKKTIWTTLLNILRQAKKVIFLDAFITTKTTNFIASVEMGVFPGTIFERSKELPGPKVNFVKNQSKMEADIIMKLKAGKKLFIFYPHKEGTSNIKSMWDLNSMIEEATGFKDRGYLYNADQDDTIKKTLKNVNDEWILKDYIITNTVITCGVNFDRAHFDETFLFVASFNCPREIAQVSHRIRKLTSNTINIGYMGKMSQPNTFIKDTLQMDCPLYTALYDSILVEKKSPLKSTLQLFFTKAHYKTQTDEATLTKELETYMAKLNSECDVSYKYADIADCSVTEADELNNKIMKQEASMTDKLRCLKYFYQAMFKSESRDLCITLTSDDGSEDDWPALEYAWNKKLRKDFFEKIQDVISNEEHLLQRIQRLNGFTEGIFPTSKEMRHVKLDPELTEAINKQFEFKRKPSDCKKLLKETYNTFFGRAIITTEYQEGAKNATYTVNSEYNVLHAFACLHLKEKKPEGAVWIGLHHSGQDTVNKIKNWEEENLSAATVAMDLAEDENTTSKEEPMEPASSAAAKAQRIRAVEGLFKWFNLPYEFPEEIFGRSMFKIVDGNVQSHGSVKSIGIYKDGDFKPVTCEGDILKEIIVPKIGKCRLGLCNLVYDGDLYEKGTVKAIGIWKQGKFNPGPHSFHKRNCCI